MRAVDLIQRKRDGGELSRDEIDFFVQGYARGEIPDYQASALTMAVLFRGMTPAEISALTESMMRSGEVLDLSALPAPRPTSTRPAASGTRRAWSWVPWPPPAASSCP